MATCSTISFIIFTTTTTTTKTTTAAAAAATATAAAAATSVHRHYPACPFLALSQTVLSLHAAFAENAAAKIKVHAVYLKKR
jgi:hypothetical protein